MYLLKDSLLSLAVLLANKLSQMDGKWVILSKFWVENLAYVATLCQGNNHAQLLRKGGEFLSHGGNSLRGGFKSSRATTVVL